MNRRQFLTLGAAAAAAECLADAVPAVELKDLTDDDFRRAVDTLEKTKYTDVAGRAKALEVVQKYIYAMKTGRPYTAFSSAELSCSPSRVQEIHDTYPVLWWYDRAFDKVLAELKETKVTGDTPAVWYVYNMGIVVKTRSSAFAVDLCHRKAIEMVPFLDFAFVSHNHEDHYLPGFLSEMKRAGKHCFTNFSLQWDSYCAEDTTLKLKDVTVHVTRTDHNTHLPNAVNCHEIVCGGEKPFVIFHAGDSHRADQLRTKNPVDLFFGHCAIGFSFPEAFFTTMKAKKLLTVHHQELGHLGGRWRCVGFHEEPARIRKQFEALGFGARIGMPVWGDRIV